MNHSIASLALIISLVLLLPTAALGSTNDVVDVSRLKSWRDLKPIDSLPNKRGISCFQFQLENGSEVSLVVARYGDWRVIPINNSPTAPTSEAARRAGAVAAVNGGFFNLSNGESTSYVVIDGQQVCDPTKNKALTANPKLQSFLETIYDRTELRILRDDKGVEKLSITNHNAPLPEGEHLFHSLQAGPRLLPEVQDKEEAFLRAEPDGKLMDSIGSHKTAARTAFGYTPGCKQIMIISVAGKGQAEFSSGITLAQLAELMRKLGCSEAVNFDGGTSTTMIVRQDDSSTGYKMLCGKNPETRVKSVLGLFPAQAGQR